MNEGANILKGRANNQLVLDKNGGVTVSTGNSFILVNSSNIPQPSTTTPSSNTSNFIIPKTNSTNSLPVLLEDVIPLYYPTESVPLAPTGTLMDTADSLLPSTEEIFDVLFEGETVFIPTDGLGSTDPLINPLATTISPTKNTSNNGTSPVCSIDNYTKISANRKLPPTALSYQKALANLEKEVKSKSYSKNVKLLAAIIATQEGWNNPNSSQHDAKNPGNIIGTGDAGTYPVTFPFGTINFAKFSTYEKGWIAQIEKVIIPYINGTISTLKYPGATVNINWLKEEDNAYYKKSGIAYKELSSYSYTSGPPTFRQFFNAYAPKCDKITDPIGYAANVVKTFEKYFNKKINVDEPVKNVL